MPIREACHVALQKIHPSKQRLWKHAQARRLAKGQASAPVLQIVRTCVWKVNLLLITLVLNDGAIICIPFFWRTVSSITGLNFIFSLLFCDNDQLNVEWCSFLIFYFSSCFSSIITLHDFECFSMLLSMVLSDSWVHKKHIF